MISGEVKEVGQCHRRRRGRLIQSMSIAEVLYVGVKVRTLTCFNHNEYGVRTQVDECKLAMFKLPSKSFEGGY